MMATTLQCFRKEGFEPRVRFIETGYVPPEKATYSQELVRVSSILRQGRSASCVILNSVSGRLHPDILAITLLRLQGRRPAIVLAGEMWMGSRGVRGAIDAAFIRSIDPAVTLYAVHSTEEMSVFPKQWGVSAEKMRLCPYYCDVDEPRVEDIPARGSYVFAGGNSLRDYEPLLEAARALPDTRFVLATKVLTGRSVPPNVTAGPTSSRDYVRLAAGASVVVTPVQSGMVRAAGQQTYLNAMSMGRIVVVNEAFGVRDHIRHMVDGVIVDGSAASYAGAIAFALDPSNENQIRGMQAAARQTARTRFSRRHYVERLFGIGLEAERMSGTGPTGGKVPVRG